MRWLTVVEGVAVAAFTILAAIAVFDQPPPLPTINVQALAGGQAEERWMGVFLEGKHVGYAMSREAPAAGGGTIYQQQSAFKIGSMGTTQQIVTAGTALTDDQGRLRQFDFLLSSPVTIAGRGVVEASQIRMEIVQAGTTNTLEIPISEPPVLGETLPAQLRGRKLTPGTSFNVPYFDPVTMTPGQMKVLVETTELLPNGDDGYWLRTSVSGVETRRLVDAQGESIREETGMGFSLQRMTAEEAKDVPDGEAPDMVAMVSVPFTGQMRAPRDSKVLEVRVSGVEASRFADNPPYQAVVGDVLKVEIPLLAQIPSVPVRGEGNTEATLTLPAQNPEILDRAKQVVGDAPDRLEAVRRLNQFVFTYVQKVPSIGIPNGLEVLRRAEGDCNEHTALFVTLARAAGIPSRIAAGLVWSERLGNAFYYHAWPEVEFAPGQWVPVDPTFGQLPADATHLKIVNGDLERQIEIMGLIGKVKLEVLTSR